MIRTLFPILLLTLLLAACGTAQTPASPTAALPPTETPAPTQAAAAPVEVTLTSLPPPSETPQAIATSRGPDLHATDPATVALASGSLQLVEFFRFT